MPLGAAMEKFAAFRLASYGTKYIPLPSVLLLLLLLLLSLANLPSGFIRIA